MCIMWCPVSRAQSHDSDGRVVGRLRRCWSHPLSRLLRSWWRVILIILTPLLFLPIPIVLKDDVSETIICDDVHLCTYYHRCYNYCTCSSITSTFSCLVSNIKMLRGQDCYYDYCLVGCFWYIAKLLISIYMVMCVYCPVHEPLTCIDG